MQCDNKYESFYWNDFNFDPCKKTDEKHEYVCINLIFILVNAVLIQGSSFKPYIQLIISICVITYEYVKYCIIIV